MSWEEFQGPMENPQEQQQQPQQQQSQQRVTPISLALAVLRAMDTLRDAICRNSSLPREISEKCEEICNKLKDMAFEVIQWYNSMYSRYGSNRAWRRRTWGKRSRGSSRRWRL